MNRRVAGVLIKGVGWEFQTLGGGYYAAAKLLSLPVASLEGP
jgi:hypothetical protein